MSKEKNSEIILATVAAKYSDGLSLIFDGQTEATAKHYKCNKSCAVKKGDRVKLTKDSGTYLVDYAVGKPGSIYINVADLTTTATTAQIVARINLICTILSGFGFLYKDGG